jgi:transposase
MELLREEETLPQIAAKYEIHPNQLTRWRKAVIEGIPDLLAEK